MKHRIITIVCCLLLASAAQAQKKTLEILHTNDTHSCIYPLNKNLTDTMLAGRGGFIRRIAMLDEQRRRNPDLLLFDSGDFCQGSAYFTMFKGDVEADLMNLMHYDAGTIGNHEFDFGLENMARVFRRLNFPIVCANLDFTGTPVEGIVKPYVIIRRGDVKIGVFGLSPQPEGLVFKGNYEGVRYLDPADCARQMADRLRNDEKCDVVVCLSHLGWFADPTLGDQQVIRSTRNIDLVLGGHTHTYMPAMELVPNADGRLIGDDQNGKHGIFIGRILLDLE